MALKEYAIIFAILILFSSFIIFTIDAFYQKPLYENYCNSTQFYQEIYQNDLKQEPNNCTYNYEIEKDCYNNQGIPVFDFDENGCRYIKNCDLCQKDFNLAMKNYNKNLFFILAIIGVLSIIFGIYYKIEFIGTGFMFSGIFLLFFGTMQTFNDLDKFIRPFVLLLELSLILFIAYKKIVIKSENNKQINKKTN